MPLQPPPPGAPPPAARPPVHQTTGAPPGRSGWDSPPPAHRPVVTAGTLITRTLEVWWRNLGKLVLLSLVMVLPMVVIMGLMAGAGVAFGSQDAPPDPERLMPVIGGVVAVTALVMFPLAMLLLGGVNYGVIRWLAGQPAGVGDMLSQGARRLWGLVLAGLLVMLAIMGGYILLIVPGIMVAVATSLALPAVTVERIGAVAAFKRSLELTRGLRWSLFAAFLAILGINMIAGLVGALLGLIPLLGIVLNLGVSLVIGSMPYVLPAVAYHDLRVMKEGVDTAQLARVFE